MDINEINKEIETFLSFLTIHISLIFNPQKLVKYILNASIKKLIIKSILLLFINYFILKIIFEIINTSKNINYLQIPVMIVIISIVYCFCFPFIFISLKINLKEKIKLSVFSSIFIHNTLLPLIYIFFICFILTEIYVFYFVTIFIAIIINIFIFIIYPLFFNKKLFKAISILSSLGIFLVINYSTLILTTDKTNSNIYQDPIFHEFIEIQPKYLEIVVYINENSQLLIDSEQKFIAEGNYSYYDILKNQMATVINQKNEIEILLSKINFNRNKKCLILILEIIDIYEKILFEYDRLKINFSQKKLIELEIDLQEKIERNQNAKEKLQILNEKIKEHQRTDLPLSQSIIIEIESLKGEIEQLSNEKRENEVLMANMAVHGNAQKKIISLTEKLNAVMNNLLNETKKDIDFYDWRIKIPF
jgi:hypothetical protein